jgi:hypothetical protein
MFIEELHKDVVKRIRDEKPPAFRESNVGWPSESLATVSPFNVGECKRALFYKILGHPSTSGMSPRVRKICDAGIMYEDAAIRMFKNSLYHLDSQVRIQYEMPGTENKVVLSGKMDEIIKDGCKKGIEIKTVYGYKAMGIFGAKGKIPLPVASNLMQAMLYKHKAMNEEINGHTLDEIYLMYINREDGCEIYFLVDLDDAGYPVITPIDMEGNTHDRISLVEYPSYEALMQHSTKATSDQSRYAEIRININDVFKKFDETFSYARAGMLPEKDYSLVYNREELEREYHCGRISKIKYNKHNKGEKAGDFKCAYCSYKTKCLEDDGIRFKEI